MKNDTLQFALSLAEAAEVEIMSRFQQCAIDLKPDGSEVTEGDRRAEAVMRELIVRHLPAHMILGKNTADRNLR